MSGSSSSKKDNALVSACVRNPALLDQVSQSILEELVDEIALGIAFEIHRYNLSLISLVEIVLLILNSRG